MSWEGMQTAPHDGTTIIVRYPLQGNVKRIAHYNTLHKFWESNGEPFLPVQQHCQWAAIPPDVATPSSANGAEGLLELPPLPTTVHCVRNGLGGIAFMAYTPEEMQAYARAALRAAGVEAA